jgi:hypothetical protein
MQHVVVPPMEVTLADGKAYHFHPLTITAWAEFQTWINKSEGKSASTPRTFDDLLVMAQSPSGMLWLLHWSVNKGRDAGAKVKLDDLLGDITSTADLVSDLMDLSTSSKDDQGNVTEG